jgi:fluoride ion exporter CrcB/FEX
MDMKGLLLNVVGAFFMGVATGLENNTKDGQFNVILCAFRGGFIAVYTSFAWVVEHSHVQMHSKDAAWSLTMCTFFALGKVAVGCLLNWLGRSLAWSLVRRYNLLKATSWQRHVPLALLFFTALCLVVDFSTANYESMWVVLIHATAAV